MLACELLQKVATSVQGFSPLWAGAATLNPATAAILQKLPVVVKDLGARSPTLHRTTSPSTVVSLLKAACDQPRRVHGLSPCQRNEDTDRVLAGRGMQPPNCTNHTRLVHPEGRRLIKVPRHEGRC